MSLAIDHVNIVVKSLPTMLEFYSGVLGLEATKRGVISGAWVDAVVGLGGVRADYVYLDCPGGGPRIELLAYQTPAAAAARLEGLGVGNTLGLRHLAFSVDDIESVVGRLRGRGVEFLSAVQTVPTAQAQYAAGARKHIVYFRDPEGNLLELCEYK